MELNTYQEDAIKTAFYPGKGTLLGLVYTSLGLGESGEAQGVVKKIIRDGSCIPTSDDINRIIAELGDVLWYVAAVAVEIGVTLDHVAETNLKKLSSRKVRGCLGGSGDDR